MTRPLMPRPNSLELIQMPSQTLQDKKAAAKAAARANAVEQVKSSLMPQNKVTPQTKVADIVAQRVQEKQQQKAIGADYTPTSQQTDRNNEANNIQGLGQQTTLDGAYQKMYDDYKQQTTLNNNRNIANSNKLAQQQAALAGYNPALGADYVNRATASAYDANQQANLGLMQQEDELLMRQKGENEQKQREYLEMLKGIDPNLAMKFQSDMLNGAIGADYTSYMNKDGSWKTKSDVQQGFDAKVSELMFYQPNLSRGQAEQMIRDNYNANLTQQQKESDYELTTRSLNTMNANAIKRAFEAGENPFVNATAEDIAAWATANHVPNVKSEQNLKDKHFKPGEFVVYDGKVYTVEKLEGSAIKRQAVLAPLDGGNTIKSVEYRDV